MSRWTRLAMISVTVLAHAAGAAAEPVDIGQTRQLFVDNLVIEDLSNVTLTLHQPTRHDRNPVFRAEKPWESGSVAPGTVLYDEEAGRFRMWYRAVSEASHVCYATSPDGIRWTRPELGLVRHGGSSTNNIVLPGAAPGPHPDGLAVVRDPHEPDPAKRFRMLTATGARQVAALISPDGIHWEGPVNPERHQSGGAVSLYFDSGLAAHVALLEGRAAVEDTQRRARLLSFSDDFVTWTDPRPALVPDRHDPPGTHFTSHVAFMYAGLRLGYLAVHDERTKRTSTQLVYSRDGRRWHRYRERVPFLPPGPEGSWDAGGAVAGASGLIERDGRIWIYYGGYATEADGPRHVGLAHLRRDGFVSADAGADGGTLLTRPLIGAGTRLRINADARHGRIRTELLDARKPPAEADVLATSVPFRGDALDALLEWADGSADLVAGRPVRIRFHLENARLYAFEFADDSPPRVVFLVSEDPQNYEAHETIPPFAEMLQEAHGFRCRVIQGEGEPEAFRFPGLEELEADLLVIFFRRRALPPEQLEWIRAHLEAGRPLIGLRTANHAFSMRGDVAEGHEQWWEFVPDVLGCENRGYGREALGMNVAVVPEAAGHPILRHITLPEWRAEGSLYLVAPLVDPQATALLTGAVEDRVEPVAWTRIHGASRVFYTSLGYPSHFEQPQFRQLLVNAVHWSLGRTGP